MKKQSLLNPVKKRKRTIAFLGLAAVLFAYSSYNENRKNGENTMLTQLFDEAQYLPEKDKLNIRSRLKKEPAPPFEKVEVISESSPIFKVENTTAKQLSLPEVSIQTGQQTVSAPSDGPKELNYGFSENLQGIIGKSEEFPIDDPGDNTFTVLLETALDDKKEIYLVYELYGLADASGASVALNDNFSRGGYLVKRSKNWITHKERINPDELIEGINFVRFSTLPSADYAYMIKNIRFEVSDLNIGEQSIALNQTELKSYNGSVYLSGFADKSFQSVMINGKEIGLRNGVFEAVVENAETEIVISAAGQDYHFPVSEETEESPDKITLPETQNKTASAYFTAWSENTISDFGATLNVPAESMEKDQTFYLSALRFQDVSALSPEMVNVTANHSGFRLLPHGEHFVNSPATLEIPYDETMIPSGYKPQDIKTFYFDNRQRKWIALERDTVLLDKKVIVSKTAHFTDFVNGIIKVPESPETGSFTPTSIKDIKAADPAAGIVSIAPPTPNNMGTATTGFPIKLPAGRAGMQPSLSVNYNSEGGNGWMGIGWDLSLPSISIDTRWGAPRYDTAKETEIYSLAGSMLTLSTDGGYTNPHRTGDISRTSERQFYPRIEGSYARIIRHGSNPNNYWWEVTDKMGNKSFYGGYTGTGVVSNAVIKTSDGNIAHWALYRTEDTNGNYVQYSYAQGIGTAGYEFYPKEISYTRHTDQQTPQYYKVTFILDSAIGTPSSRTDIQTNARLGLVQSTSKLLNEIKIELTDGLNPEKIRSYRFDYETKAFSKKQLIRISEFDSNDNLFYSNTMEYYEDVTDGNFMDTNVNQDWDGHTDGIKGDLINFSLNNFSNEGSMLGTTKSWGIGGGGSFNVGVGYNVFSKLNSVGVNFGYNYNESEGLISFADMNGDGLPDKIIKKNNRVYYRPNIGEVSGNGFGEPIEITGLRDFSKNVANSFSVGVEANFILFAGYTYSRSTSKQKIYFSDVNGDGLIDLVRPSGVIFNSTINPNTDIRNFIPSTESTPNYVPFGNVNNDIINNLELETLETLESQNPLHDIVKRWVAPAEGKVKITKKAILSPLSLPSQEDEYIEDYDGVAISIEKATGNFPSATQTIFSKTLTFDLPSADIDIANISVNPGDRLYFRVHSIKEGSFDRVEWNPQIKYTLISDGLSILLEQADDNGFQYYSSSASDGFITSADGGVTIPSGATAVVEWDESEPQYSYPAYTYSDNLIYKVIIGDVNLETGEFTPSMTFTKNGNQNSSNTIAESGFLSGFTSLANYSIPSGKTVKFEVSSNSNVDWKKINWRPQIKMTVSGVEQIFNSVVNYSIYNKKRSALSHTARKNVTENKPLQLNIERPNQYFLSEKLAVNDCKKVVMVVKNNQKRLLLTKTFSAKVTLATLGNIKTLSLHNNATCSGNAVQTITSYVTNSVNVTNPVFADFYVDDYELVRVGNFEASLFQQDLNNNYTISKGVSKAISAKAGNDEYGPGYHYWGHFVYNSTSANPSHPAAAIDESKLVIEEISEQEYPTENPDCSYCDNLEGEEYGDCMEACMDSFLEDLDIPDPLNAVLNQLTPLMDAKLPESEYIADVWMGKENQTYIEENFFSSSRFGVKNINTIYLDPASISSQLAPGITIISNGDGDSVVGSLGPIGGSWSMSFNNTRNQFMDMNGDRYPDIVTNGLIQYTAPTGKLDDSYENDLGRPTTGESELSGSSVSGTFIYSNNGNKGNPSAKIGMGNLSDIPVIGPKTEPQQNSSASLSGNSSNGSNKEYLLWVDINGDGLPDRIDAESGSIKVRLNLGYRFDEEKTWANTPNSIKGETSNFSSGVGGGFSILNNSWGGGITLSSSEGFTIDNFVDLNGDGLPDLVRQIKNENGGKIAYRLNTGTGFEPNEHIIDDAYIQFNRGTGQGLNISFTYGFTPILLPIKFTTTITAAGNLGLDRVERTITDINGDGYADILYTPSGGNDGDLSVRLNKTGKTHLLKRVNLPLGGHWEIDYEREQNSYEMPNAKWKMTHIEVHDGFTGDNAFTPDVARTSAEYENPRHDRREREFMGYEKVKVNQLDVLNNNAVYRYSLQEYHNDDYYLKGAVKSDALYGRKNTGNGFRLLTSTETTYTVTDREDPSTEAADQAPPFAFNTARDKSSLFVSPVRTTKKYKEETGGNKTTYTEIKTFDQNGNVTKYIDKGEGEADRITANVTYVNDPVFRGLPKKITVKSDGNTIRYRETNYDNKGNPEYIRTKLNAEGEFATVSFDYDDYGNIEKVTHEESKDENGDPFFYEYTYDSQLHTYPVKTEDAFGYSSQNTYDYRFGALVYTEDMNYKPMRTRIDDRGRVVEITGPYELFVEGLTTGDPAWTIRFEYEGEATVASRVANIEFTDYLIDAEGKFEASDNFSTVITNAKHHAVTRHFDPEFRTDPETPLTENEIYTITLIDGLGKPIQVKKSTSIKTAVTNHSGDITKAVIDARDTRKWLVNGKVETDAFGRAVKTWYPILEDYNVSNPFNTAALSYNATAYETGENFYTEATYDALDRVLTTKLPGETAEMLTSYSIEAGLFKTTVVNELNQTKHSFTDVRGRTTKVVEDSNNAGTITTEFTYNALSELIKVEDTDGNITESFYDMAGRRTELRHPDNGITKFTYDNASNLIAKETANLLAENNAEKIEYFYTFNRLDSIVYPKYPHNNVHFFYGQAEDASAVDDFSVGRLWYQIDATGVQQFKYGRLGEVRYNLRSVAVPGDKAYWFKTEWEYDTWNRVKKIIYPDEEEVSYFYNRGGELHAITSKKQEQQNEDIISQLGYDKFGQRTYLRYGNGTETYYKYETDRRRLENMTAKSNTTYGSSVNRTFINNNYSYDILSNVLSVENTAALPGAGKIGGTVEYTYTYDDLNRLKTATGNFTGRNTADTGYEYQKYSLVMEYDNMHNILSKNQIHETSPDNTNWTKAHQTTYDLTYEKYNTAEYNVAGYSYTQPHAVRQIIDKPEATSTGNDVKAKMYDYDANGNLTAITQKTGESDVVEKLRTNLWDEENRLRAVDITPDAEGVRPIAIYTYDAGGERILKHSNTSVSIYLNGKKVADTIQTNAMLYPSGMLVARVIPTEEESLSLGYTKHYYAGTQRVSSKIGTTENLGDYLYDWFTQGTGGPVDVIGSSFGVLENAEEGVVQVYDELGIEPPTYESTPVFIPVQSFVHGGNEVEQYYFHPDHLGSTSYISNLLGEVSQHMEYFAFGETFVEEHRSSNNSPYKFNGKELDEETGWYYYGARYYDPRISVWLSVDPLTEQTMTPYQYGKQNPIKYVDSNGLKGEDWVETNGKMLYDSRVIDQKSAKVYYGNDAKYYAPGEKYQSVNNTNVELGLGGYFKEDGVTNRAIDNAPSVYAFPLDGSSGVTAISAFTSYKRYTQYNEFFEIWRGKNGKIYNGLKGRGPNGVTGSRGYAKGKASQIGIAGNILGGLGMMATYADYKYNMNQNPGPNLKRYLESRHLKDQSFNGAGFLGQFGAAASFGYNLGYLIEDVCNCNIQINPYTLDFTPIEQTLTDFDNAGLHNVYR